MSTPRKSTLNAEDNPPAYSSPISNAATPAHSSTAPTSGPVSKPESRPEDARSIGDAVGSAGNQASPEKNAPASMTGIASRTVPTSSDDLKAQLENANATILRLKEQIEDQTGLRQRKAAPDTGDKDPAVSHPALATQHAPQGVPVPITAALCLVSFLLAYLLF